MEQLHILGFGAQLTTDAYLAHDRSVQDATNFLCSIDDELTPLQDASALKDMTLPTTTSRNTGTTWSD
ncbi:hypothetical protein N9L68_00635 [bacterium]|nr:hypothetical protein [bacterium]